MPEVKDSKKQTCAKGTQTCISWTADKKKYLEEHGHDEIFAEKKFRRRVESTSANLGKVKVKLMDFLQRRESKDIVISKGIMKPRLVFGAELDDVVSRESIGDGVPLFVRRSIGAIEAPGRIDREGIYRINGNASQIQKLSLIVDENADYDLHDTRWDVHTLTGAFKMFFREMQNPLLPEEFYAKMKDLIVTQNLKGQNLAKKTKPIVSLIPGNRLATFKALVTHLLNVIKADNRMTTENLGLVFGPNIMWCRDKNEQFDAWSVEKVMIPTQVLQLVLKNPSLLDANVGDVN